MSLSYRLCKSEDHTTGRSFEISSNGLWCMIGWCSSNPWCKLSIKNPQEINRYWSKLKTVSRISDGNTLSKWWRNSSKNLTLRTFSWNQLIFNRKNCLTPIFNIEFAIYGVQCFAVSFFQHAKTDLHSTSDSQKQKCRSKNPELRKSPEGRKIP